MQRPSYCRSIAGHLDFVAMLLCLPAPKSSSGMYCCLCSYSQWSRKIDLSSVYILCNMY
uniref:Uncharacterized protein n=1 Tax=Anguilla anguilla TaxID=7936 RepID=A0A0E9S8A6_ANGAN